MTNKQSRPHVRYYEKTDTLKGDCRFDVVPIVCSVKRQVSGRCEDLDRKKLSVAARKKHQHRNVFTPSTGVLSVGKGFAVSYISTISAIDFMNQRLPSVQTHCKSPNGGRSNATTASRTSLGICVCLQVRGVSEST